MIVALVLGLGIATARCDLIEVNYCHDDIGQLRFIQIIPCDWSHDYHRRHAQGWLIVREVIQVQGGVIGIDDAGKRWRLSGPVIETRTRYDTEVENRKVFPEQLRRKVW